MNEQMDIDYFFETLWNKFNISINFTKINMRVVGTLSTTPSQLSSINDTLYSIINQNHKLDAIYLNIPYTKDEDYNIPDEYNNYCNIIKCTDYGSITKLIGPLLEEHDDETIIITFNDNVIYPHGLVEKLISKSKLFPDTAIGSSGIKLGSFPFYFSFSNNTNNYWYSFPIKQDGENVDILSSYSGVLYLRKFFPSADNLNDLLKYSKIKNLTNNDDVVISGYLSLKNYDRKIFILPTPTLPTRNNFSLSLIKSLIEAYKNKMFKKRAKYDIKKTFLYPCVIILFLTITIPIILLLIK
jgi:hypothetical protein